ncbi:MAG: PAS domain S-box protein [Actinomycetota bacterium]
MSVRVGRPATRQGDVPETVERAQAILDKLPLAFFSVDRQFRLTFANAMAERLMQKPRSEVIGRNLWEEFPEATDALFHEAGLKAVDEPAVVDLEVYYPPRDMWLEVHADLVEDGFDVFVRDVTERRKTEEALRRRDAILEAVRYAAERFLRDPSWTDGIDAVLARLGEATGVSRVYIFENHRAEDGSVRHSQRHEWVSAGIAALIDDPLLHDFSFHEHGTGRWEEVLGRGGVISGHAHELPKRERPVLEAQNILSIAVVPIFVGEEWWGFIGFDGCVAEREWSAAEIDALKAAADALGAAIERRQGEERTREAEAKFRTLVEQIPAITYVAMPDGKSTKLHVSPQIETVLGYRAEDWVSDPEAWIRSVHPDDLDRVLSEMSRSHETGEPFSQELRMIAADGRVVWVQDESVVIADTEGRPKFVQGVFFDVTERRTLEEAPRRSAELLEASLESTADGILVVGEKRETIFANKEFAAMWRIPDELLRTRSDERLIGFVLDQLEAPEAFIAKINQLHQTSEESFDTLLFKDGRVFERFSRPLTHDGEVAGRVWSFRDVTERRRTEQALRESEDRLSRIVETIAEGIAIIDMDERVAFVNEAAARIVGVSREETIGRRYDDPRWRFLTPSGAPFEAEDRPFAQVRMTGRPVFGVEIARERPDGTRAVWSTNAVPLHDATGALAGVLLSLRDVSEAKGAEEELLAAEAKYRTLVEQLPVVVHSYAIDTTPSRPTYVSPQVEALFGYTPEQWLADPLLWVNAIHQDDRERVMAEDARTSKPEGSFSMEYRVVARDGRVVWVRDEAVVRPAKGADEPFRQGVLVDITKVKEAEAELEKSRVMMTEAQQLAHIGSWEWDVLTDEVTWSDELYRIYGLEAGSPLSYDRCLDCLHPDDREMVHRTVEATFASHESFGFEHRIVRPDGAVRTLYGTGRVILNEAGDVVRMFGTGLDISERKGAEEELQESFQLLRAADQGRRQLLSRLVSAQEDERKRIAADIHDDSIQKMTAVGLRLEALRRATDEVARTKTLDQLNETVELSIHRLRRLMFELRPPGLDREGLAAALREHLDDVAKEAGLETHLENRLVTEPPSVTRAIAYRIAQEALANVRKHAEARRVEVLLDSREQGLFVRIRDDGVGLARTEMPTPGHLGLSAMRERAELAGGWWQLGSAPGGGTAVEFWLPLAAEEGAAETT